MTYQPLARKYRPSQFGELVGQESVATALANAIALGREPHAVLFTGVRGVGKTTLARLYAKTLNCEARQAFRGGVEPCHQCESCLAIARGNHEDVLEIDGASNTGVNDVRALQETLEYRPQRSMFKVYIIDEVHMLSQAAFNALLKTLEEPPSHVVFVFATTEIHKVPETILSRCQAFFLNKLSATLIQNRIKDILAQEQIPFEDAAVVRLAKEGHGSMRDALTLLDQAIALGHGQVTVAALSAMMANFSSAPYLELLKALIVKDAGQLISLASDLDQKGVEFSTAAEELARLARHGFILKTLGRAAPEIAMMGLDDAELTTLTGIVDLAAPLDLNRVFRTLAQCRTELDGSALDRYIFENYLLEWCLDPGLPDMEALLSQQVVKPVAAAAATAAASPAAMRSAVAELKSPQAINRARPVAQEIQAASRPAAAASVVSHTSVPAGNGVKRLPVTWRELVDGWKQLKPLQARKLEEAHPLAYGPDKITLAVSDASYASKVLLQREEQVKVREQLKELYGFDGVLTIQPMQASVAPTTAVAEPLPDTILTQRAREGEAKRQELYQAAESANFTQDVVQKLGGKVEQVRVL